MIRRVAKPHGVVTLDQLRELGLGPRGVRHRAATGRLRKMYAGVYAVERPGPEGRWLAAVLACGTGAVLSHESAAALWDLAAARRNIDVAVPKGQRRKRPGLRVHRMALAPEDVTTRRGIPCTTVARTLVDLAGVVDRSTLERAADRAEEQRVFDLSALRTQIERMRGMRGSAALAAVLAAYDGPDRTASGAEQRLMALVQTARLPTPEINAWIALPEGGGYRPDFLWRDRGLIVEVDGRAHHTRRASFEHDRRRDRRLACLGLETRRYAAREVLAEPAVVVAELRAFLESPSERA